MGSVHNLSWTASQSISTRWTSTGRRKGARNVLSLSIALLRCCPVNFSYGQQFHSHMLIYVNVIYLDKFEEFSRRKIMFLVFHSPHHGPHLEGK